MSGESGFASVLTLIALMLAALVSMAWWRSYQQVRESLTYERAMIAEYAAEGGANKAIDAAKGGAASGAWKGRIGDGIYVVKLVPGGGRRIVESRGYWSPGAGNPAAGLLAKLFRGGGYKTRLTVRGRVVAGRFVTESIQKIP